MAFIHNLNAPVLITLLNNTAGTVKGRAEFSTTPTQENRYLVVYTDEYGRSRVAWWPESNLLPGV